MPTISDESSEAPTPVDLIPVSPEAAAALLRGKARQANGRYRLRGRGLASRPGYATAAVVEFSRLARNEITASERLIAHTPLDLPASGRVLAKAGFTARGRVEDEHDGQAITVEKWELSLR